MPPPPQSVPILDADNPWPGLNSYDEAGARFFNGREQEVADLQRLITHAPVTVLFGKSGLGKSSLIRAGLFPVLRTERMLPIYVRFAFGSASQESVALIDQVAAAFDAERTAVGAEAPLRLQRQSFWDYLHRDDFRVWSAETQPLTPLFVFDQLEELFTIGSAYPELIARWREDLADLAENRIPVATALGLRAQQAREPVVDADSAMHPPLLLNRQNYRVLLSFREDFATAFERWPELPSLMRNRFRLNPMSGTQALDAITRSGGTLVDAVVAEEIVRFVGSQADPPRAVPQSAMPTAVVAPRTVPDQPLSAISIEPALLSLVCRGLNERRKNAGKAAIESESLRQTGRGLIDQYYDECMDKQPDSVHRFIENELITESGQRKSCAADDAARPPYYIRFEDLDVLVERRLLRRLPSAQVSSVELVHDLLTPTVLARRNRRRSDPAQYQTALRRARRAEAPAAATVNPAMLLECVVANTDLSFEHVPLFVGHYETARLTGTEATADHLMGGALSGSLNLGIYPVAPGESQHFVNRRVRPPHTRPLPPRVIVVGLGAEGHLLGAELTRSMRQAVVGLMQQLEPSRPAGAGTIIACTLMGSGGAGISPGSAAEWVAQGVREANEVLAGAGQGHCVTTLRLVERYSDRAEQAWRSLQTLAMAHPDAFLVHGEIEEGIGSLERPLNFGYRGTDADLLRVQTTDDGSDRRIDYEFYSVYRADGIEARVTATPLVINLVERAANALDQTPGIGDTLHALLIPAELETLFATTANLRLELDAGTAALPWELLERASTEGVRLPWAIRAKVVRSLRASTFRPKVLRALGATSALVIGEPRTPVGFSRLFGAQTEAHEAERVLVNGLGTEDVLKLAAPDFASDGPDARVVMSALFKRPWRIVHLAGHCVAPTDRDSGGLLLSNDSLIGPAELQALAEVPEFVFLNGCYRNDVASAPAAAAHNPVRFAAGMAEALLAIGVRVVIVAGWRIEDVAAHAFVRALYAGLLDGRRLADAVAEARAVAYQFDGETWGAFQCYGDADWILRTAAAETRQPAVRQRLTTIASAKMLILELRTIATRLRFDGVNARAELDTVTELERLYGQRWGLHGAVAEAFAIAFAAVGRLESAIDWYERAIAADDAKASLSAMEQLFNLRVRSAWDSIHSAVDPAAGLLAKLTRSASGRRSRALPPSSPQRAGIMDAARAQIVDAARAYERLIALQPTATREALYGAAMKRLAMIELSAGRESAAARAIAQMALRYRHAFEISSTGGSNDSFYFGLNAVKAETWLTGQRRRKANLRSELVEATRGRLRASLGEAPTFWTLVAEIELQLCEALASHRLTAVASRLRRSLHDVRKRMNQPTMWVSVRNDAAFVMGPYIASARRPAERLAAIALLTLLDQFLAPGFASGTPETPSRAARRPKR